MNTREQGVTTLTTEDLNEQAEELITRKEVEGTPFTVVGMEGKFFGSMGKYRITEPVESQEKAIAEIQDINWNRIVQVMSILILEQEQVKEFTNES